MGGGGALTSLMSLTPVRTLSLSCGIFLHKLLVEMVAVEEIEHAD
jgi:hypothetical protein